MKSKISLGMILLSMGFFLSIGCSSVSYYTTFGGTNTNPTPEYSAAYGLAYKGGTLFHSAVIPGAVSNVPVAVNASGRACQTSFMTLISVGDSSLEEAKRLGSIEKIAYVEYRQLGVIAGYVFHIFCTTVHGETKGVK